MNPTSIGDWLTQFAKSHGLPKLSPHDFRRSLATMLAEENVSEKMISDWLGHSDVATTHRFYEYLLSDEKAHIAQTISSVFFEKEEEETPTHLRIRKRNSPSEPLCAESRVKYHQDPLSIDK